MLTLVTWAESEAFVVLRARSNQYAVLGVRASTSVNANGVEEVVELACTDAGAEPPNRDPDWAALFDGADPDP